MKASDYIVEYLIQRQVTDIYGYPGGMVTHLIDSLYKYRDRIRSHITYNEQGAAFAACGYAQTKNAVGVAYATSGPGATNLITGICNAYFDSIPTLFITGQVNSNEQKGLLPVRQRGFQETEIVSMVSSVTKYASKVVDVSMLKAELDKAFYHATSGRKGPVLLDIAMDVFRSEIDVNESKSAEEPNSKATKSKAGHEVFDTNALKGIFTESLNNAKRPVLLLGRGAENADIEAVLKHNNIPIVTSMIAIDQVSWSDMNFGFIGAYGDRSANFLVAKSDLVIAVGARMDVRQVGAKRENFAPDSKIIRIDIDEGELEYKVHQDEIGICKDAKEALSVLSDILSYGEYDFAEWLGVCKEIADRLKGVDEPTFYNAVMHRLSKQVPANTIITTDVGQNQVWTAQSFDVKKGQKVFFSGGHGAMGYSLPAAIGCAHASNKSVVCITGDGGIQMNIQEMQTIIREHLPIKIILFNNHALGMIRHFQEMYFDSVYSQTVVGSGYGNPDFSGIAKAYGFKYHSITSIRDLEDTNIDFEDGIPELIEIKIDTDTYVFPKLEFGKPNQDQEPLIDRQLYKELMEL